MTAAAISGTFANYRLIKTRGVLVIEIEVGVEAQAVVFEALGYPMPGESIHVAVARLNPNTAATPHAVAEPAVVPERAENRDSCAGVPAQLSAQSHRGSGPADGAIVKRAGILANDQHFWLWINVQSSEDAADFIRRACGVKSRRDLATNTGAAIRFQGLLDEFDAATGRRAELRS